MPALGKALLWTVALALSVSACSQPDAKTNYSVEFCIAPSNWEHLKKMMVEFGERYGLEFHGKIEPLSELKNSNLRDKLNYALIDGLHQIGGDDFDLWLTSDPFSENRVYFSVLSKHDLTSKQRAIAADFKNALEPLVCEALQMP